MVTFTFSQSVWEFAKLCDIFAMRASMVYMPKACQLFIFTCQRANKCANVPKVCQFFHFFLKEFFNFSFLQLYSIFANFKNILDFLEKQILDFLLNLSSETSNLNFNICKISFKKNLVNLKPFDIAFVRLTKQLFG